jgi:hypothetical protein
VGGVVFRVFPVALARGKHLFPFRTEQLSPSAPMVLGPQGPGRVGRRRFLQQSDTAALRGGRCRWGARGESHRAPVAASRVARPHAGPGRGAHAGARPCRRARASRTGGRGASAGRPDAPARARAATPGADVAPEGARSGRPPSRRRSRPRAKGTSGSSAGHRARAVQAWMFSSDRTCVRKVRPRADGTDANTRTYRPRGWKSALECGNRASDLQAKLQIGAVWQAGWSGRHCCHAGRWRGA